MTTFADRFKPAASLERYKEITGQGGGGTGTGERGAVMVEPGAESEARAKQKAVIIAAWPRCGDKHKYLYKFKNGDSICSQGWREEFYYHQMMGTVPPKWMLDPAQRAGAGIATDPIITFKDASKRRLILLVGVGAGLVGLALIFRKRRQS
jgi:hypothetical protein